MSKFIRCHICSHEYFYPEEHECLKPKCKWCKRKINTGHYCEISAMLTQIDHSEDSYELSSACVELFEYMLKRMTHPHMLEEPK